MIKNKSNYIHKFFSFNENNVQALQERQIWFAKLNSFNDPFEGMASKEWTSPTDKEIIDYCKAPANRGNINLILGNQYEGDILQKLIPIFADESKKEALVERIRTAVEIAFSEILKKANSRGASCFSLSEIGNEDKPLKDLLMWGHYTSGLRGFALTFDVRKLFLEEMKIDSFYEGPVEIIYDDTHPKLNLKDYLLDYYVGNNKRAIRRLYDVLRTKAKVWSYENECRYLAPVGLHTYSPEALVGITIGSKLSEWQINTLESLACRIGDINIRIAGLKEGQYEIELISSK